MTWNIERGYAPSNIAETIRQIRPDIACLQEVDWGNERTGNRDVLADLAEQLGMLGLFGIEFIELQSQRRGARLAGGGVTGNAVLTRFEPVSAFRLSLPPCLDWERGATSMDLPTRLRRRIAREPRLGQRFRSWRRVCARPTSTDRVLAAPGRQVRRRAWTLVAIQRGAGGGSTPLRHHDRQRDRRRLQHLQQPPRAPVPAGEPDDRSWQTLGDDPRRNGGRRCCCHRRATPTRFRPAPGPSL